MARYSSLSSCFCVLALLCFAAIVSADRLECPEGFDTDCGERCYRVIHRTREWAEAKAYCANLHASLASIRNEQEQFCVSGIRNSSDDRDDAHWWLGLTSDHENVTDPLNWKWEDPTVAVGNGSFDYWAYVGDLREPNNEDGSERCAAMIFASEYRIDRSGPYFNAWGVWNNAACTEDKHFVCEAQKVPALVAGSWNENTTSEEPTVGTTSGIVPSGQAVDSSTAAVPAQETTQSATTTDAATTTSAPVVVSTVASAMAAAAAIAASSANNATTVSV